MVAVADLKLQRLGGPAALIPQGVEGWRGGKKDPSRVQGNLDVAAAGLRWDVARGSF